MTELYRGILLILFNKFNDLIITLREHIRSYKQQTTDPTNYMDIGVLGFWNLMLEISVSVFGMAVLATGVALVAVLAMVFYPLTALFNLCASVLINTRHPESSTMKLEKKVEPVVEESPVFIIKKEK
jgi:hypothetical protein